MMVQMPFLSVGAGRRALSLCQGQGGDVMDECGHCFAMYTAVLCVPLGLKDPWTLKTIRAILGTPEKWCLLRRQEEA